MVAGFQISNPNILPNLFDDFLVFYADEWGKPHPSFEFNLETHACPKFAIFLALLIEKEFETSGGPQI